MNISKNQNFIPKTKDGVEIKKGMKLYWADFAVVKEFTVNCWNDGKTGNLDFRQNKCDAYFVNVRGRGGAGVYTKQHRNVYSFIPMRECFKDLNKAKEYLASHFEKLAKKIRNSEPIKMKSTI